MPEHRPSYSLKRSLQPPVHSSLQGQLLLAMPSMPDDLFHQSIIYICAHSEEGAMGLVVNKVHDELAFGDLLTELSILPPPNTGPNTGPDSSLEPGTDNADQIVVRNKDGKVQLINGGPVEQHRGFVLHSNDYLLSGTMPVGSHIGLTSTSDVLHHIYDGTGPSRALVAMGYSGWGAGQLEEEISQNGWLVAPCDSELLFSVPLGKRYEECLKKIGVDIGQLSCDIGHA